MLLLGILFGCAKEPSLAGGKPVSYWVDALKDDPDPHVRKTAAHKLGNVGQSNPAAFPALLGALHDPDASVRAEAILAVTKFGSSATEAVPILTDLAKDDPDEQVRDYAGKALAKLRLAN
jgi:HEAT repeat protein